MPGNGYAISVLTRFQYASADSAALLGMDAILKYDGNAPIAAVYGFPIKALDWPNRTFARANKRAWP